MRLDASPAAVLRLPPDSPVRRLAVQLAARDVLEERPYQCGCGERYVAVGNPPTFHPLDGRFSDPELVCRNAKCRRVL